MRPGQFVNVSPPLDSTLLRRPLGVYRTIDGTDIELLFKVVGKGTAALAGVRPDDRIDLIGPLGNGFDLSVVNSPRIDTDKHGWNSSSPRNGEIGVYPCSSVVSSSFAPPETAVLVAGGFGVAPLHLLALALREKVKRICVFVGTEEELPLDMSDSSMHASFIDPDVKLTLTDFEALGALARVATLKNRPGFFHGLVTDLLEKFLHHPEPLGRTKLYACGPWAMLKRTAAIAAEHKLDCDVLLEERMGCGIGACMSCAVRLKTGHGGPVYVRACVEGPVFAAAAVDWDAK